MNTPPTITPSINAPTTTTTPDASRLVRRVILLSLLICGIVTLYFGARLRNFAVDDAYITFRHALNLSNGEGFTFNPGERLLSTTSPLHALILAFFASIGFRDSIPQTAIVLSVASMLALCVSIYLCFDKVGMAPAGTLAIVLVVSQHWLYRFFSLETIFVLALNVTTVALALRLRWTWAGVTAGIAMIGRPDSIIVAGIVGLYCIVVTKSLYRQLWRYAVPVVLIYGLWLTFSLLYFGHPFPNTLAAKSGFATWTVFVDAIWPKMLSTLIPLYVPASALLVILASIGLIDLIFQRSPLLIFPIWGLLHTIGYSLLRIPYPFAWYYAPLILITLMLAAVGGMTIARLMQYWAKDGTLLARAITAAMVIVVLGLGLLSLQGTWSFVSTYDTAYYGGARDSVYQKAGRWLAENGRPGSSVALTEVGTIGYFSHLHIIDLAGLVTYELRDLPKQGGYGETIAALQPDYVVGVRGLPPDPQLQGLEGYSVVQEYPKGQDNLFEDIVIYQSDKELLNK